MQQPTQQVESCLSTVINKYKVLSSQNTQYKHRLSALHRLHTTLQQLNVAISSYERTFCENDTVSCDVREVGQLRETLQVCLLVYLFSLLYIFVVIIMIHKYLFVLGYRDSQDCQYHRVNIVLYDIFSCFSPSYTSTSLMLTN